MNATSPVPALFAPPSRSAASAAYVVNWRDRLLTRYFRNHWRGFFPLLRLLRPQGEITVRSRYGAIFPLRTGEYIEGTVLGLGYYESEVFEALRRWFTPNAVFWDIGANIGLHAISAAKLFPRLEVHAFEPNPDTFARLQRHIAGNAVAVRAWSLALGEADGAGTLHVPTEENSGRSTLVANAETTDWPAAQVRIARADTLVARGELSAPTVVKLDVEGCEPSVLAGFGSLLRAETLRAVVFESAADLLAAPRDCPCARALLDAGFELRALHREENTAHLLGNFLAARP